MERWQQETSSEIYEERISMYIDFSKFNYNLIPKYEQEAYIKRDKEAYAGILKKWVEMNLNKIIDRKWEIEDISCIKETSDFVKLLKEAESYMN